MLDFKKLENARRMEIVYYDLDTLDKKDIRDFRIEHNMTQNTLARILGVSKKAVEKWEQGKNQINKSASNLLWILKNNENLIDKFYSVKIVENKALEISFVTTSEVATPPQFEIEDSYTTIKSYKGNKEIFEKCLV